MRHLIPAERLRVFQDAGSVYENGRRGDVAGATGIGFSLCLVYAAIRFEVPGFPFEVAAAAFGVGAFWSLRRGNVTVGRLKAIAASALLIELALLAIWFYRYRAHQLAFQDWWFVAASEAVPFVGLTFFAWTTAARLSLLPFAHRAAYEAVRAEVERAELHSELEADAATRTFLGGTRLWFVRPLDEFAIIIRLGLDRRSKTAFEKLAIVPVSKQAIADRLVEMDGAEAVAAVQEKLGWPK